MKEINHLGLFLGVFFQKKFGFWHFLRVFAIWRLFVAVSDVSLVFRFSIKLRVLARRSSGIAAVGEQTAKL
jgi:hypothetical protein